MLQLLIALVIIGAILYLINIIPMDSRIKTVIMVLAIVFIVIWALRILAPMAGIS